MDIRKTGAGFLILDDRANALLVDALHAKIQSTITTQFRRNYSNWYDLPIEEVITKTCEKIRVFKDQYELYVFLGGTDMLGFKLKYPKV